MSKYAPLQKFLSNKGFSEIPLTFSEIESVVGHQLPASARKYRAWWSNNSGNSVMTHAWLAAGYRSAKVNLEGEKVVFIKADGAATSDPKPSKPSKPTTRPAIFGCMSGTVTVSVNVDLTAPSLDAWPEAELPGGNASHG